MGKSRFKYLGKRVKDIALEGLDSPSEFYGILKAIIHDYKRGRITKSTARGRLLLLFRLTYPEKNKKVKRLAGSTRREIRKKIRLTMSEL